MIYNQFNQDSNYTEDLLLINFEKKNSVIESEYNPDYRYGWGVTVNKGGLHFDKIAAYYNPNTFARVPL